MFWQVISVFFLADKTQIIFPQTILKTTKTRIHSSRMLTARSLSYGGLPDRDPSGQRPSGQDLPGETLWTETSLDRGSPWQRPPAQRPPDRDPHTATLLDRAPLSRLLTDRRLWKHYLRKLRLRAITRPVNVQIIQDKFFKLHFTKINLNHQVSLLPSKHKFVRN